MTARYETLLLARTEVTKDEQQMLEDFYDKMSSKAQGKLTVFDPWGKCSLAYPVQKNSYGYYMFVRFELGKEHVTEALQDLNTFLKIKCHDIVLRYTTVKLAPDAPTTYHKPDVFGKSDTGNIDHAKEEKIESLLDSVGSSSAKPQESSEEKPQEEAPAEPAPKEEPEASSESSSESN